MTIRKRYDEAQVLISHDLYEPALIILLVATAGASERYRRHTTGGAKKGNGDDRKWFSNYVSSAISVKFGDRHAADILYQDLRCEIIHEAIIDNSKFDSGPSLMVIDGSKLTFGAGLLASLSELLRTDPLGRDEFRDLLSEFENLIEFKGNNKNSFLEEFAEAHSLTSGRVTILELILRGFRPEPLGQMSYDDMASTFEEKLMPNLRHFGLNGAAIGVLRGGWELTSVLDIRGRLTREGFEIIKDLTSHYQTIDAA